MANKDNDDFVFPPITIRGALEAHLASVRNPEMLTTSDMNWVINYLESEVIEQCDLYNNPELVAACGSSDMSVKDAARVIAKKIWEYWNFADDNYDIF